MGFIVFGQCKQCNDGVEKRLVSRAKSLCPYHCQKEKYEKAKDKRDINKIEVSKKQKEVEKEDAKFYRKIWKDRKHISEVGGEPLGDKMTHWFMSHILTKKLYPHYRYNPENILLMTKAEHYQWEFGKLDSEKWEKVKALQEKLRIEYNQKERDGAWS